MVTNTSPDRLGPRRAPWRPGFVLVTSEHGGHEVPAPYAACFASPEAQAALRSHRGHDPGTLGVAQRLADRLGAPLVASTTTRLLVELNRSLDHPQLFSRFVAALDARQREQLLDHHYRPHRRRVEGLLARAVERGRPALHLAMHSFVDELDGERRAVDIGLLFDPDRRAELEVCAAWRAALEVARPDLRIRFNEPYLGTDDGLTTALRLRFPSASYAGIEIEVRQGMLRTAGDERAIADLLLGTLASAVALPEADMQDAGRSPSLR